LIGGGHHLAESGARGGSGTKAILPFRRLVDEVQCGRLRELRWFNQGAANESQRPPIPNSPAEAHQGTAYPPNRHQVAIGLV